MIHRMLCLVLLLATFANVAVAQNEIVEEPATRHLVVVTGVGGTEAFANNFRLWASQWTDAAATAGLRTTTIDGTDADKSGSQQLQHTLQEAGNSVDELWVVLIGHGTFDGAEAKFNLVGDDVSAEQMKEWLRPRDKLTIVVNCASCSAPFVEALAGKNRVVVTSTKSGYELSFAHFGRYLAETIGSSDVDLDKDDQTSLLEAVIAANGKTSEFYKSDSRLPSEHALVEDNSDGRGTPVEWYRGVRVNRKAKDGTPPDGLRANQVFFSRRGVDALLPAALIKKRDGLEEQIQELRSQRGQLTEEQYYRELESLMVELANLYESVPTRKDN